MGKPDEERLASVAVAVRREFDVILERDADGYHVASVPALPGCHTQGRTLDQVHARIREAIEICLREGGQPATDTGFVGVRRVVVASGR